MARYVVGWFVGSEEKADVIHEAQSFGEAVNFLQVHFRWMAEDWPEHADRCWELAQMLSRGDLMAYIDAGRMHLSVGESTFYIARPEGTDVYGGLF